MDGTTHRIDRRRTTRRFPALEEALTRVRLRTGRELSVVDISDSGMLIEGVVRLLPGTHVDVHVVTHGGRVLVRSRIVRAYVWRLHRDSVEYRCAIAFERMVDTAAGYSIPGNARKVTPLPGSDYPPGGAAAIATHQQDL